MTASSEKFVDLGSPRRVWAVAAIHGNQEHLMTLHDHLAVRFKVQDRLVYLGNYLGVPTFENHAVLNELLAFRSALMAKSGVEVSDIVHLRGPAEEAWQRLLRLQFAPSPAMALERYLEAGAESYLRLYGVSLNETKSMARAGSVSITRWTNQLRNIQRQALGHEPLVCSLRRAAVTAPANDGTGSMLFVPAGFDMQRSLDDQGDQLWFGNTPFSVAEGASKYARIIRGFDAHRRGVNTSGVAVTLDGGCGSGGPLVCGCFDGQGHLLEMITVGGRGAIESSRFENVEPISTAPSQQRLPATTTITEPTFWSQQQGAM